MRFFRLLLTGLALVGGVKATVSLAHAQKPSGPPEGNVKLSAEAIEFFEKKIRPALIQHCYQCHGGGKKQGGLTLDTREGLRKGGASGPVVIPGKPAESLLIKALHHEGKQMPPTGKLPDAVIADFAKWVAMGAPDPRESNIPKMPTSWEEAFKARKNWWSLLPVRKTKLPAVQDARWSQLPIDRFVLAPLEKAGLTPNLPADKRMLIRRAALVLTGLPPHPQEVEAFVNDKSPQAYERLVDRLLAAPQFGERWARHWMDAVRFGETHGYEWNYEVREAWRYRDYLIRAFNLDVPYDQLVREHLAGDLLTTPRRNRVEQINESLIGTASLRFGEAGHDNFREIGYDQVDNQIDTISKAFQATTVTCARCHDHKLDAISTRDYYALFGILLSARQVVHTLDTNDVNAGTKGRLRELKTQIQRELAAQWGREVGEAGKFFRAAQAARVKSAEAAQLAIPVEAARLQKWVAALDAKNVGMEEPVFVWNALAGKSGEGLTSAWQELTSRYEMEARERANYNAQNFTPLADFRAPTSAAQGGGSGWQWQGWHLDGQGLRDGAGKSGDFAVACEGETAVTGIFPAGLFTNTLSERLNGSLFSPDLPKSKPYISLQVIGGKQAMLRMVPDFRHLTDFNREIKLDKLGWFTMGRQANNYDDRVYFELVTKLDNQRIPERAAGKRKATLDDQRSYFGVVRAVAHERAEAPKEELSHMLPLFTADTPPQSMEEVADRYAALLQQALNAWADGRATDDDVRWLDWLVRSGLVTNSMKTTPKLAELVARYREVEKQLEEPRVVAGMGDVDEGHDQAVLVRGDFKTLGEVVQRRYLEVLGNGDNRLCDRGSGRRELAEQIVNPNNPLTARVMVNRLWHWMFGAGLVRTVDDFGHMGEPPSHPELLDYLATRFVAEGWSIKQLIREIALTKTFQMASATSPKVKEKDPENRLLSHYPARRLEAEAIRDSMLAVSGRLDGALFGPSIDPYREKPTPERKLYGGPLDGNGRRSVYTKITLMEAPKFLSVFNLPEAKLAQGRRDVTNVPAQALALLNDPFVIQQADVWAKRLVAEHDAAVASRIARMFLTALSRSPQRDEAAQFENFVKELASLNNVASDDVLKNATIWKDVAHAVFNLKEFVYVP